MGVINNFETKNTLEDISNKFLLEGIIGAGLNYDISEKISAEISYNYRMSLNELYKTGEYNLNSHSFIINLFYSL